MNRNLIIGALIFAGLLVIGLGVFLIHTLATRVNANQMSAMEQINARKAIARDPFAGREQDAINIVRNYTVLNPEYIDGLMESKKSGKPLEVEFGLVTIESLVEQQFLEKRFNMEFLTKGEWRAECSDRTEKPPESRKSKKNAELSRN